MDTPPICMRRYPSTDATTSTSLKLEGPCGARHATPSRSAYSKKRPGGSAAAKASAYDAYSRKRRHRSASVASLISMMSKRAGWIVQTTRRRRSRPLAPGKAWGTKRPIVEGSTCAETSRPATRSETRTGAMVRSSLRCAARESGFGADGAPGSGGAGGSDGAAAGSGAAGGSGKTRGCGSGAGRATSVAVMSSQFRC